jgi:hypothetical protein
MTRLAAARDRLHKAAGISVLLDAAYQAFELMLTAIEDHQDPASGMFSQFVTAATSAADGRDDILSAPSLPARPLHPARESASMTGPADDAGVHEIVALSAALSQALTGAAATVAGEADRAACRAAAGRAAAVHRLLTGVDP